jgi:hypothetical protein
MKAKTKVCIQCGQRKQLDMFRWRKDTKTYRTTCLECEKAYSRAWAKAYPLKNRAYKRERREGITRSESLRKESIYYGWTWMWRRATILGTTPREIDAWILKSEGRCDICNVPLIGFGTKRHALCFDHCHTTKIIRGVLCPACNVAIGHLDDNPQKAILAANYLRRIAGPG